MIRFKSCLVDFFVKYSSFERVRDRSLSINLPIVTQIRFVIELKAAIPTSVQFGIDKDVLVIENCLDKSRNTVQFSFLGIQASF